MWRQLLQKWTSNSEPRPLNQQQAEALVDALVFAMMADGVAHDEEFRELHRGLEDLEWRGEISLESYTSQAIANIDEVKISREAARAHCRAIGERLQDRPARERAYAIASRIVCADGDVAEPERGLMSLFIQEFSISEDRAFELAADAHKAFQLL